MTLLTTTLALDLSDSTTWYGTAITANSTTLVVTDGYRYAYYTGYGFQYSGTEVVGGTLTGFSQSAGGVTHLRVTDFSISAAEADRYISANQTYLLYPRVLAGNDTITGSAYADRLLGFSGNDVLRGNGGRDTLDGGTGTDVAVYANPRQSYTITRTADGWSVTDRTGLDGTDQLAHIEVLQFANGTQVMAPRDSVTQHVALLYQGALGRTPDGTGLAYWVDIASRLPFATQGLYALSDQSGGYNGNLSVAAGFTLSLEFQAKYGKLTNAQFVTQLYANVLDRAPDAAGLVDWVSQLDRGTSRERVLVGFAESPEAIQNASVGFIGQSGWHEPWLYLG